jgi:hypothetical protein
MPSVRLPSMPIKDQQVLDKSSQGRTQSPRGLLPMGLALKARLVIHLQVLDLCVVACRPLLRHITSLQVHIMLSHRS